MELAEASDGAAQHESEQMGEDDGDRKTMR